MYVRLLSFSIFRIILRVHLPTIKKHKLFVSAQTHIGTSHFDAAFFKIKNITIMKNN